jgi:hypothetical protein
VVRFARGVVIGALSAPITYMLQLATLWSLDAGRDVVVSAVAESTAAPAGATSALMHVAVDFSVVGGAAADARALADYLRSYITPDYRVGNTTAGVRLEYAGPVVPAPRV